VVERGRRGYNYRDGRAQKERLKESQTADDGLNNDRAEYAQGT